MTEPSFANLISKMNEVQYAVDKNQEPEKFYARCDENLLLHRQSIQESYDTLIEKGVPEKYIFVINANRNDPSKQGDIFAFTDQERLEEVLSWVREHASLCLSPDVFVNLCVDVRDQATMSMYIDANYFDAKWFKEMIKEIM